MRCHVCTDQQEEQWIRSQVTKRAYEIYQMRLNSEVWHYGVYGTPNGDWTQAEREIKESIFFYCGANNENARGQDRPTETKEDGSKTD